MAAESIAENLGEKFVVVVNKSTVPIGSGNWVEAIIREHYFEVRNAKPNGLFNVVSSPEFLAQGAALHGSFYPDRIIIGSEHQPSIERLKELFGPIIRQDFEAPACLPRPAGLSEVPMLVCDVTSAEMVKYAANSFLALKISFINEIAQLTQKIGAEFRRSLKELGWISASGIAFWMPASAGEVRALARTQPLWWQQQKITIWTCPSFVLRGMSIMLNACGWWIACRKS